MVNRPAPIDPNGKQLEEAIGHYGDKRVIEFTPIIELNAVTPISALRDDTQTSGTGTVTSVASEYRIRGQTSGDFARITSSARGRYLPGTTAEMGIGLRIPQTFTTDDGVMYWGYFDMQVSGSTNTEDINDAVVFGSDAQGTFVQVFKSGTSIHKTYQTDWNLDNDTGLDLAKGHIFQIQFNYYGYGLICWQRIIAVPGVENQYTKTMHTWKPDEETSLDNTNLQVGALVKNGTSDEDVSIYLGGRKFGVYGPFVPKSRVSSKTVISKSIPSSGFTPIMTFRRNITRRDVSLELFNFSLITNNDIQIIIMVGTSLTGASYGSVDRKQTGESALEVDTSATAYSGGNEVFADLAQGGGGTNRQLTNISELPQSIPDEANITFAAKAISTTATVTLTGKLREEW